MVPVKFWVVGQAVQFAPPWVKPGLYVPDAQRLHDELESEPRAILPSAVPVPKPGRHVSQSVWATAAIVMVVEVPAGHWLQEPLPMKPL
jgi:hypothetical protein